MLEKLLLAFKAPQDLEQTFETLLQLEIRLRLRGTPEQPFDGSLVAVLVTKLKYYILVLTAQHILIRHLRDELDRRAPQKSGAAESRTTPRL